MTKLTIEFEAADLRFTQLIITLATFWFLSSMLDADNERKRRRKAKARARQQARQDAARRWKPHGSNRPGM